MISSLEIHQAYFYTPGMLAQGVTINNIINISRFVVVVLTITNSYRRHNTEIIFFKFGF